MNKTLLLIICDFLLLNLLALTRWEKAEPARPTQAPVPEVNANAVTRDQDLVETMRLSVADEQAQRDQLAEKLTVADSALAAREQSLSAAQVEARRLAAEKSSLASTLTESQRNLTDLSKRLTAVSQESTLTKEQLAQLQRELAERQAELERQRVRAAELERKNADALKQIGTLNTAVAVAEQEKIGLREQAQTLQTQVVAERSERLKAMETTSQLASGVGQLAEKSGELTKEIRDNRPINANVLYNDFLQNRVSTTFTAARRSLLGTVNRTKEAQTVLVGDGRQVYALMHVDDTMFGFALDNNPDWERLRVEFARPPSYRSEAGTVEFLAQDPRVMVLPVDAAQVSALGARVYALAADPFKFPEAVLVNARGKGYGEVGFKLDAAQPGFVRVDNRLFKRLFGDFAPSPGDLVFSKTGELLGIMVNSDYCAVLKDFTPARTLTPGENIAGQHTGALLDGLSASMRAMPLKLQ